MSNTIEEEANINVTDDRSLGSILYIALSTHMDNTRHYGVLQRVRANYVNQV